MVRLAEDVSVIILHLSTPATRMQIDSHFIPSHLYVFLRFFKLEQF